MRWITARWVEALCLLSAVAIVIAWGLYTQHVWEDFLITYRVSRNLLDGNGLVFNVGVRLHTFTSPVQVLLPALLSLISRRSDVATIWLYRILGGFALGGAVAITLDTARRCAWPLAAAVLGVALVLFDGKSIDFTVSGMETPFLLLGLALFLRGILSDCGWFQTGLIWAVMMWIRPDAFVLVGSIAAAMLVFGPLNPGSLLQDRVPAPEIRAWRRRVFFQFLAASAVVVVLYGPWIGWATWYYGSPIPNTVIAKGLLVGQHHGVLERLFFILAAPLRCLGRDLFLTDLYGATYAGPVPDWGVYFHGIWKLMALVPWLYWLSPMGSRVARCLSFSVFIISFYAASMEVLFPWYVPPFAMIATFAWMAIGSDIWNRRWRNDSGAEVDIPVSIGGVPSPRVGGKSLFFWHISVLALVVVLILGQGLTAIEMAREMRVQQALIEDGNRKVIGLWLGQHSNPSLDTVFLEPIGYIGYYSQLKLFDFPGLTSPEMIDARRRLNTNDFATLIDALHPTWLVLRPREISGIQVSHPGLLDDRGNGNGTYLLEKVFDQTAAVRALPDSGLSRFFGRTYLEGDQTFSVFKRRS